MSAAALTGQVVDTYCDLHRHCTSLRAITGSKRGRVVGKAYQVLLRDVTFRVQPGGLRRVRETGEREVHAYARGTLAATEAAPVRDDPAAVRVRYNPFRFDGFVRADTEEILAGADALAIEGKCAWAIGPRAA
jgi:hypothetical protein